MRRFVLASTLWLLPVLAPAQPSADRVSLCGHAVRVERRADGTHALLGLRDGAITLGEGTASDESVRLANGAAWIVRVARDGASAEAVVAVCAGVAAPRLAWRGSLRWRGEDIGDRTREEVIARRVGEVSEVVIARRVESPRVCGVEGVVIDAARVDPVTATLGPRAGVDPLEFIALTAQGSVSVASAAASRSMFSPRSAVASAGEVGALFDGDPGTVWSSGAHGYVTVTLPSSAFTLRAIDFILPRSNPVSARRWSIFVDPGARRFDIELPAGPLPVGRVWRASMPEPLRARCVSLVARGAPPRSGLGEVTLRSALDEGPDALAGLVRALDGPDGDAAAAMLGELGPVGAGALLPGFATMSVTGARRALRVLAAARSPETITALVGALGREDTAEAASELLIHMGPGALSALGAVAATSPRAARVIADINAPIGARLTTMAPALRAERGVWGAARPVFGSLLARSSPTEVSAWLEGLSDGALESSRALSVAAESVAQDSPSRALIGSRARQAWARSEDFEARYRLIPALVGDVEGAGLVREALAHGADHDLRARAASALARSTRSRDTLVQALNDRTPRVRAAAAESLRNMEGGRDALVRTLANDPWPSVRAAAALALAEDASAAGALLGALDAESVVTVRAALTALTRNTGATVSARLMAFVEEARRNPELRRLAAEALGERCDRSIASDLERVAGTLSDPTLPPWAQEIGHAALASLARVDPARARAFMTRAEANAEASAAVERAARSACPR